MRASEKSYNSEFGVPLTILGSKNPWTDALGWFRVLKEACALLLLPNHYPTILVLEVGADRPGDLAKILRIATPDVVVVTWLPEIPVHVEAYISPEAVREEEFVPAYGLAQGAPLIIASEDHHARTYAKRLAANVSSFGFDKEATVRIEHPRVFMEGDMVSGMEATLSTNEGTYDIKVQGALGRPQLLAPAAALASALALEIPIEEALTGLATYAPPPGRMRIFKGKEDALLIDDSYNASPAAVEEALSTLSLVEAKRRIVILGDMLELGRYSVSEHERIARLAASSADVFVTVGIRARAMAEVARKAGLRDDAVISFDSSKNATQPLVSLVRKGDVVLIKGSQSIRMERIVEALLADPLDVVNLVRQDKEWRRR